MRYRISKPDEYLAITGMGIRSVRITKAVWVWPFQRCTRFSVRPHDYAMDLQAMTKEKLQFSLPVVFTVGPDVNRRGANALGGGGDAGDNDFPNHGSNKTKSSYVGHGSAHGSSSIVNNTNNNKTTPLDDIEDRGDALVKYAMLLANAGHVHQAVAKAAPTGTDDDASQSAHVANIIKGIIEGETRVLVSSLTMEEIFSERDVFKRRIFRNIQSELDQFGLKIYNANVKELKDAPGSVYFGSLSRKAHEGATNQARIDVADAQLRGTVGEAQRRGQQDRETAKISAETAVQKTERDIECAQAEARLKTTEAGLGRDVEIARVTAKRALESRDEDLKRDVQLKRAAAELERRRASDVVAATVARESSQQDADAAAYQARAQADAAAYQVRAEADADAYAVEKATDAAASGKQRDAEALAYMADAYAKLADAFGGPQGLLRYLMIEKDTYVQLAKANADAVRGLGPKISIWNTGAASNSAGSDSLDAMRNVYQMLPPLMTTIHDQTGITLPEWQFGRISAQQKAMSDENGAAAS